MNDLLEQYKQEHPLLSADEVRLLKRFVEYLNLGLRTCICGNKFSPVSNKNIRCFACAGNPSRVRKMKKLYPLIKIKTKKIDPVTREINKDHYAKNRDYYLEYARQKYIKKNLSSSHI